MTAKPTSQINNTADFPESLCPLEKLSWLSDSDGFANAFSENHCGPWRYLKEKCFGMSPFKGTKKLSMFLMFSDHFDLNSDINFE